MAITILTHTVDMRNGIQDLNDWIAATTVNSILSVSVINNNFLLILYT